MRILKYELPYRGTIGMQLPDGAVVRSCGVQGDSIVIWAAVDEKKPKTLRTFAVAWTGDDEPGGAVFVGTVQNPRTGIVSHVYEVL